MDWEAAGAEAVAMLAGYLRVDTSNPPGNESAGADYLAGVLSAAGIPSERVAFAPGRDSLVARLHGDGTEAPLCLLSHLDVAASEPTRWTHPPFSGAILEGQIWGRGA